MSILSPDNPLGGRSLRIYYITVMLALALFAPFMRVDNRIERWVHPEAAELADYEDFQATFGSDEFILIAYGGRPLFDETALEVQRNVLEALESLPSVERVSGIPAVDRELFGGEDPAGLEQDFLSTPFYRNLFISQDAQTAGLLVELRAGEVDRDNKALARSVHTATDPLRSAGFEVHAGGPPLLNAALDESSSKESARTFPLALGLSVIVLLLLFRSWRATLLASSCGALTVAATCGLMVVLQRPMNMVSAALPALLWVLSLAGTIHVLHEYRCCRREGLDGRAAALRSHRASAQATWIAGVTTAAGFLSLVTASMAPLRELGVFAACGVLLGTGLILLVLPALLPFWTPRMDARGPHGQHPGFAARWPKWVAGHYRAILGLALLFAVASSAALPQLRVSSDPLAFLPADSQTVKDYAAIADKLTGFYTLEVVIDLGALWTTPEAWSAVARVQDSLTKEHGVARVLSPLDLLKKLKHWQGGMEPEAYRLPESQDEAEQLLSEMGDFGRENLKRLVSPEGRQVRLSVLINVMDSTSFMNIVRKAKQSLAELPPPMQGHCTGVVLQLVENQLALVRTQISSFGSACLIIFGCIGIFLRSWRMMLVSIVPNVLPLGVVFVAMACWGLPLDPATVMVASVALGIAVDDTAHSTLR